MGGQGNGRAGEWEGREWEGEWEGKGMGGQGNGKAREWEGKGMGGKGMGGQGNGKAREWEGEGMRKSSGSEFTDCFGFFRCRHSSTHSSLAPIPLAFP